MGFFLSEAPEARSEAEWVRLLASHSAAESRAAVAALWEYWLNEAGLAARAEIDRGIESMHAGNLEDAEMIFTRLMDRHPGWAEAINKKATVLYMEGRCEESIDLCTEVVKLKPDHFGAWNGIALCALQCGEWLLAREAAIQSLRLQPGSDCNRQILAMVDSRLAVC